VIIALCVLLLWAVAAAFYWQWTTAKAREQLVLRIMADGAWWRGRDIVKESGRAVPSYDIYLVLHRLEDAGLLESRFEEEHEVAVDVGIVRRLYRLVLLGRAPARLVS
jgi:DNA-binding PadR family transcriptional regulator